jgi:hypothetical protein
MMEMAVKRKVTIPNLAITGGPSNFRIYQQDAAGRADIEIAGKWHSAAGCRDIRILVRLRSEEDSSPVPPAGDWTPVQRMGRGAWGHVIRGVPAGGLYLLQTQMQWKRPDGTQAIQVRQSVHHLGVGDLWLIGGQSNGEGSGRGIAQDGPQPGVHVLKPGNPELGVEPWWDLAVHPISESAGTSPNLRFAKVLSRELGYPIGLIQTASGGSPLIHWHPEENPQAPWWHRMVRCVGVAGGKVRGMVWYQGEHDASVPGKLHLAVEYGKRFARFVELARKEFGRFWVLVSQLNRWSDVVLSADVQRGWTIVREAQRHVGSIGQACCVPTIDLPVSDGIHNSSAGNVVLGERLARAALGTVFKRPVLWRAPDVRRATAADRGRAIVLEFDHVTSRLALTGMGLEDFLVEDSLGPAAVAKTVCTGSTVRLELARPLSGKAYVHGAYGADPEVGLKDLETNLPMLGFYKLPVKAGK